MKRLLTCLGITFVIAFGLGLLVHIPGRTSGVLVQQVDDRILRITPGTKSASYLIPGDQSYAAIKTLFTSSASTTQTAAVAAGQRDTTAYWRDWSETFNKIVAAVAIILGGLWTYRTFVRKRESAARGEISLSVSDHLLDDNHRLLHAVVQFKNIGEGLVEVDDFTVRFQQIRPLDLAVKKRLHCGQDLVDNGDTQVCWPLIKEREKQGKIEVEPGETETLFADAVLDATITKVRVYAHINNLKKSKFGWDCEKIHELGKLEKDGGEHSEEGTGPEGEGTKASANHIADQQPAAKRELEVQPDVAHVAPIEAEEEDE